MLRACLNRGYVVFYKMFSSLSMPSVDSMSCCAIAAGLPYLVGVQNNDPNIKCLLAALMVAPLVSTCCNYIIGTAEQLKDRPFLATLSDCLQRAAQAIITFYGFKMMNEKLRYGLDTSLGVTERHLNKVLARTILSAYGPMLGFSTKFVPANETILSQFCAILLGNSVKYYNTPTEDIARHAWGIQEYAQVAAAGLVSKVLIYLSVNGINYDKKISVLNAVQKGCEGMLNYVVYNIFYHDQVPPAHKLPTFMFVKAMEEVHKTAVALTTRVLQKPFAKQIAEGRVEAATAIER